MVLDMRSTYMVVNVHVCGEGDGPYDARRWFDAFLVFARTGRKTAHTRYFSKRIFFTFGGSQSITVALVLITNRILIHHTRQSCPRALMGRGLHKFIPSSSELSETTTAGSCCGIAYERRGAPSIMAQPLRPPHLTNCTSVTPTCDKFPSENER